MKVRARKVTHPCHEETDYLVNGRIWLEKNRELYLGWGRIMLLEKIKELGSIAAAARSMKLGYRNAWLWIDAMNRLAPSPLVQKEAGGEKGGYAAVTEEGLRAITQYKELRDGFRAFIKQVS